MTSKQVTFSFLVQIADFGMARDIEESDYYVSHGGKIPVKWTAPEVCTATMQINLYIMKLVQGHIRGS